MKRLCIFLFCLLYSIPDFSQNTGQIVEDSQDFLVPFTVSQINTHSSSFHHQVKCITAKANGNLLLATDNGILEYNGNEFTTFISNDFILRTSFTKLFWHEKTGKLFGQAYKGIVYQLYPQHIAFPGFVAVDVKQDSIYGIDSSGVIYSSDVTNLHFKKRWESGSKIATCLYVDTGRIYVGSFLNLRIIDPGQKKNYLYSPENINIHGLVKDEFTNEVLAIGAYSVYKLSGWKPEKIFNIRDITNEVNIHIVGYESINAGECVVTLTNGVVLVKKDAVNCYTKENGLLTAFIQATFYNKAGNSLYLGTDDRGLLKLQFKNCLSVSSKNGLSDPGSLYSVLKTQANEILVLDRKGPVYQYKQDTIVPYMEMHNAAASLSEIDGNLYMGTWNDGLYILKNKSIVKHMTSQLELTDNSVLAAFKDSRGNIWIGTHKGISRGHSVENIRPFLKGKLNDGVMCFYELKNGTLCIGGCSGAWLIDKEGNIIKHLGKKEGIEGLGVRSFYEDKEGKLWIGTYKGGLYCLHQGKLRSINKMKNCFLFMDAFCLAPDHMGYLYITSNHGLWRVKEKDLSDFYHLKKQFLVPFYYGEETGILNTEFNGGFQNNYLSAGNTLYFPTQQGLVVVKPETPEFRKLKVFMDKIMVNDTLYKKSELVLEPGTYSVKFSFTGEPDPDKCNVFYQYKLESESKTILDWSPVQKEKSVDFELLPPGKYIFSVRAIDAFNDPQPAVSRYPFEILPFFYQTFMFKIIIVAFVVLLIIIFIRLRMNYHRKKIQKKEYYKLQSLELELKAIQAKLNPHFVFNCINCIKYFVMEEDYEKANDGLIKLSKLIRNSVEQSDKLFVPLDMEFTAVINYIELEKMRLHDQLEYSVNMDKSVTGNPFIPHLIIQPYVENAIKHGIANLINKVGVLTVDLKQEGELLVCTITDNGIGRKAAESLKQYTNLHESKGIALTREKMNLLNAFYNYNCSIRIIDLQNENESNGTMVVIEMPKLNNLTHRQVQPEQYIK